MGIQFGFDNLGHFIENIVMFIPMGMLLPCIFEKMRTDYRLVLFVSLISTVGIELLQGIVGRASDFSDMLANFIGGFFGCVIYHFVLKRKSAHF